MPCRSVEGGETRVNLKSTDFRIFRILRVPIWGQPGSETPRIWRPSGSGPLRSWDPQDLDPSDLGTLRIWRPSGSGPLRIWRPLRIWTPRILDPSGSEDLESRWDRVITPKWCHIMTPFRPYFTKLINIY